MRRAIDYRSASKTNYKLFRKEHREIHLTFDEWKTVIYSFNEGIRDHILETGEKVRFPGGLGDFSIHKWKPSKFTDPTGKVKFTLPIDWNETRKNKKITYFMNFHSEGYKFRWWWFKTSAMFKFARMWTFKPARTSMAALGRYVTNGTDYQHAIS